MINKTFAISLVVAVTVPSLFGQHPGGGHRGPGDFALLRAEFGGASKVVQGAPYSAQAVTQFTQTLANGDHIQRTMTATVSRDSLGRTRTERSFGAIGALSAGRAAAGRGSGRTVMIFDPVASKSVVLDPDSKTARSSPLPAGRSAHAGAETHARPALAAAKTEDLGTQVMQGVTAQGQRVTRAIPPGQDGNEKEIDIVTETWYSPDLQVVVMSKTSDPRYGESVYQLNGINRAEPDAALFTVPSDYAVTEGRPMGRPMRERPPAQ